MNQQLVEPKDRIIFAMDVSDPQTALKYVEHLNGAVGAFKFGLEFSWAMIANLLALPTRKDYETEGEAERRAEQEAIEFLLLYRRLHRLCGVLAFQDPKLVDIPNTVGRASLAISRLQPMMFNVHASAGSKAIAAAVENRGSSLVLGVTVLTSLQDDCISIFGDEPNNKVLQFAKMLEAEGAQGVICSPQEARLLRQAGIELMLVCPGIRPMWARKPDEKDDQERFLTPGEAEQEGVDYQVIGRPISERWDKPLVNIATPREAAEVIAFEIAQARRAS